VVAKDTDIFGCGVFGAIAYLVAETKINTHGKESK
jgi:hypothetical protein